MAQDYLRTIKSSVTKVGSGTTKVPSTRLLDRMFITLQADDNNAGPIYYGDATVSISGGIALKAGATSERLQVATDVYVSSVSGYLVRSFEIAG